MRTDGEKLMTPQEVAEYLAVPQRNLYRWRAEGTGPRAAKVGKHLRYRRADVERWLDEQASEVA